VISDCEDLMICDLAETYGIFNYQGYSPVLVGTLVFGLPDESRIKRRITKSNLTVNQILLAKIADELAFQSWAQTKDAQKGKNRPKSILQALLGEPKQQEYDTFETFEEFQNRWNSI